MTGKLFEVQWEAYVQIDGRKKHLGLFVEEEVAAAAARNARRELMPFSNEEVEHVEAI